MKVLLKKKICGSYEQCMGPTESLKSCSNTFLKKKKKKKKKGNANTNAQENQPNPNSHILLEGIINFMQFI